MCVCVRVRVRERDRQTGRQAGRQVQRERERIFDFNNPVIRCEVLEFNVPSAA